MDEYIGIIRIFAGNFAPENWMFCNGAMLSVAANTALHSVIGHAYGGDGITTFALPDLRSRIPIGIADGSEPLGFCVNQGQKDGEEAHVLDLNEITSHNHIADVSSVNASAQVPSGANSALAGLGISSGTTFTAANGYNYAQPDIVLHGATVSQTGASQAHENRQPFLAMNYIICVSGVYPPRS